MTVTRTFAILTATMAVTGAARAAEQARTEIDHQAPVVAETHLQIDAQPDAVWDVLTDVDRWPEWLPEFGAARVDGPLEAGTTLYWTPLGQEIISTFVLVERNRRLVWNGSGGAIHVWELTPRGTGTFLRNAESIETWEFPGDPADHSAFLAEMLDMWNRRLAERVRSAQ